MNFFTHLTACEILSLSTPTLTIKSCLSTQCLLLSHFPDVTMDEVLHTILIKVLQMLVVDISTKRFD